MSNDIESLAYQLKNLSSQFSTSEIELAELEN